jgi:hypothetical protein
MRFSIAFDDNGTILGASVGGDEADDPVPAPGVTRGYVDISDDVPDAALPQTVERLLIDMDTSKLEQLPTQRRADDPQY